MLIIIVYFCKLTVLGKDEKMQKKSENNEINDILTGTELKLSRQEAEDKVAEMLAAAKTQPKHSKKTEGKSAEDYDRAYYEAAERAYFAGESEKEPAGLFSRETLSMLRGKNKADEVNIEDSLDISKLAEQELTREEAEEKIANVFAAASAGKTHKSGAGTSGFGLELALLESLSFFLFIASMRSGIPGPFSPVAIFLPVIFGVAYRMVSKQLNLLEALSKCKPHIFISVFFYICLLVSI
jgi:hypothetical protein